MFLSRLSCRKWGQILDPKLWWYLGQVIDEGGSSFRLILNWCIGSSHQCKCKDGHIYGNKLYLFNMVFVLIFSQVTNKEIFWQCFLDVRQTMSAFDCCVSGVNEKQAAVVRFDWPTPGSNYFMLSTGVIRHLFLLCFSVINLLNFTKQHKTHCFKWWPTVNQKFTGLHPVIFMRWLSRSAVF